MSYFPRKADDACIKLCDKSDTHYFNQDCNEFLKTRKGLQYLLHEWRKGTGCSVDYSVEVAVWQEHLMWGWPLFE